MKSLWKKGEASRCRDELDRLVYRSRLIGQESKLCVWSGGNTSTKCEERDFLGQWKKILRVKGSGADLKTAARKDFSPLDLDKVLEAIDAQKMSEEKLASLLYSSLTDATAPRPSVESLLHAFIPKKDMNHTHPDAILSLTNTKRNREITHKVFGEELLWIPYVMSGFALAKKVAHAFEKNPQAKGALLEKHGLITWADDGKTSYDLTIEMVSRAEKYIAQCAKKKKWSGAAVATLPKPRREAFLEEFLPHLRRACSQKQRVILHYVDSPEVLKFVNSKLGPRVSQVGPATPDHMLHTKRIPLFVKGTPGKITPENLVRQVNAYAAAHEKYFWKHRKPGMLMLDPYPRVILIPGIGMVTTGKDLKSAKIAAEVYEHAISIMKGASTVDRYASLTEAQAFAMEYWALELYKLTLTPAEGEMSRQIGLVTGAAGAIGKAIAMKCARAGAHVIVADLNAQAVKKVAEEINTEVKSEKAFPCVLDVTGEKSVEAGFQTVVRTFGGIDFVVSNAGVAHVSSVEKLPLRDWNQSLAVNATGHFLIAKTAVQLMRRQQMGGAFVFIASKNVLAPGREFGAYSAAKAAETQLARILAIENGELGIRVNLINPDGVFEGSGLWERIRRSRAKTWGIAPRELEKYYQGRNLMKVPVFADDVAESVLFLVSQRSAKTTGCILTVDGGVKEAFPR